MTSNRSSSNKQNCSRKYRKCGKGTILLRDKNSSQIIAKQITCNSISCPNCYPKQKALISEKIEYFANEKELHFFLTLTSKDGYNDLKKQFDKIRRKIKDFTTDRYLSKKGLQVTDENLLKAKTWIEKEKRKIIEYDTNIQLKKWARHKAILDIAKEKNVFYNNLSLKEKRKFKEKHQNSINGKIPWKFKELKADITQVNRIKKSIQQKINLNFYKPLSYILVVEFHKSGQPHFHVLLNRYVPRLWLDKISNKNNFISDLTYLTEKMHQSVQTDGSQYTNTISKFASKTIASYLTKESFENHRKFKETMVHEGKSSLSIFQTSHDISLDKDPDEDTSKNYSIITKYPDININIPAIELPSTLTEEEMLNSVLVNSNRIVSPTAIETYETSFQIKDEQLRFDYIIEKRLQTILSNRMEDTNDLISIIKVGMDRGMSADQINAVLVIASSQLTLITGNAGTGKSSTIINALDILKPDQEQTKLCAFTGKATERLKQLLIKSQLPLYETSTIHHLCSSDFGNNFYRNHQNQINCNLIIIDEIGMVSKEIFAKFLLAVPDHCQLVFSGDDRQLKPVDGESVIPILRKYSHHEILTTNYRSEDNINKIAHNVLNYKLDNNSYQFFNNLAIVKDLVSQGYQILTNTNALRNEINGIIQSEKNEIQHLFGEHNYNLGDYVINTINDSMLKIFNGQTGVIDSFDSDSVNIRFDQRLIRYTKMRSKYIEPAYCLSIHKAQGSEYDKVAIFIGNTKKGLCNSLLYTAITRAKKNVLIYFDTEETARKCIHTQ